MSTTAVTLNSVFTTATTPQKAVVLPFPSAGTAGSAIASGGHDATPSSGGGDLATAVTALNRYVAQTRTDLSFRVDQETDSIVVSIVDSETGAVLRQMPSEEALRIARYIEHERLGLVRQQA